MSKTQIRKTNFSNSILNYADLKSMNLGLDCIFSINPKILKLCITRDGSNQNFEGENLSKLKLDGTNFSKANLRRVDLSDTNLRNS